MSKSASSDPAETETSEGGYCSLLRTGFRETVSRVREMHLAVADVSFRVLKAIPVTAPPASIVQKAHHAISNGVYATVRHGGDALIGAVGMIEGRAVARARAGNARDRRAKGLQGALNGAFGDHLDASANPLAFKMEFFDADGPVTPKKLQTGAADATDRVCLFIHGLGCNELSWRNHSETAWGAPDRDYGELLRSESGRTPLYLRYNTGLPIADNGRRLAEQVRSLLEAYPKPVRELVFICHSMGGLVAHHACRHAASEDLEWLKLTRMVICLGTPHRGAPLEKLGHITTTALRFFDVTAPLGKIGDVRSAGVKDLRRGLRSKDNPTGSPTEVPGVAHRFLGANLSPEADHLIGYVIGDGLVTLDSAVPSAPPTGSAAGKLGDLRHMKLLNDPRVYRQIKHWLDE